jgi:anionic cell wall polymer biosynthesis LytR-Cps2A-Psr (LCP) family protein
MGEVTRMRFPKALRTPLGAAFLSALFPGLGQAAAGRPNRGAIVAVPLIAMLAAFAFLVLFFRHDLPGGAVNGAWLNSLLLLDLLFLVYHLWAVAESYLLAGRAQPKRRAPRPSTQKWTATFGIGVIVAGTVGIHAGFASVDLDYQHSLYCLTARTPCSIGDAPATLATPSDFSDQGQQVADDTSSPGASSSASARPLQSFDFSNLPSMQPADASAKNWAADGQLNVLLIGADFEPGRGTTGLRPDTMIVLHVDLASGKAAMIGVPRNNVCVPLPQGIAQSYATSVNGCPPYTWGGYSRSGIASAELNWLGMEAWNHPANFPSLPQDSASGWYRAAMATEAAVGALTGLNIDGYVTINLLGLAKLIDDIGGIDITVPTRVFDEPCGPKGSWQAQYYVCAYAHNGYTVPGDAAAFQKMADDAAASNGFQTITWHAPTTAAGTDVAFVIKPGKQHMDGAWALAYARSREYSSDFVRMQRQQLVLQAMRSTIAHPCGMLGQIPSLIGDLGQTINTNLPILDSSQWRLWLGLAEQIGGGSVHTQVLDPTTTGESFIGGYPAIDNTSWAKIKDIVAHSLDNVPAASPGSGGGGGGFSC